MLSLDAQMVKARADRDAAQRNLDALKRLQQQGSASAGEVRAAENALAQADAQLNLLQQKQTRRYSQPGDWRASKHNAGKRRLRTMRRRRLSPSPMCARLSTASYIPLPVSKGAFVASGDLSACS